MAIGVSYDDFWHGDPALVRYAIETRQITERHRVISDDMLAWNTGRYVLMAVGVVLSQAFNKNSQAKYPHEPLIGPELDEELVKAKRERELIASRDGFVALAAAMYAAQHKGESPVGREYAVDNVTGEERPI